MTITIMLSSFFVFGYNNKIKQPTNENKMYILPWGCEIRLRSYQRDDVLFGLVEAAYHKEKKERCVAVCDVRNEIRVRVM